MKCKGYFRLVMIFSLALLITTSLWFASPVMLYAQGYGYGGAGGGGGGGGGESYAGVTLLGNRIGPDGILTQDVIATAFDECAELMIKEGTKFRGKTGAPLYGIFMLEMADPPSAPAGFSIVSAVYNFGPTGATFEPAATLTSCYDPNVLPAGFYEKNLAIAMFDEATGKWVILDSIVNPDDNTITTQEVSHFTAFTILAGTAPAAFTVTDLAIAPGEVGVGGEVTISVLVSNTGYLSGSYKVTLKINDVAIASEEVTVHGLTSQEVTFTTTEDAIGTYTVDVEGLTSTFEVSAAPPPAPAPLPLPAPAPAPPPTKLINWYLIGGALAGVILIGAIVWLIARRRSALIQSGH